MKFHLSILIIQLSLFIRKFKYLLKFFTKGNGYSLPGNYVLKLYPEILKDPRLNFKRGIILITGTNGKTTTSKIVTTLLTEMGLKVSHNSSGANLKNGIITQLLSSFDVFGNNHADIAVLEVDEFVLSILLMDLSPSHILLLNLSRDQLDRYGETDLIQERWVRSINKSDTSMTVILPSFDADLVKLKKDLNKYVVSFDSNCSLISETSLKGEFNEKNLSASLTLLNELGFDLKAIEPHLKQIRPAYGRGEVLNVFDNSYTLFLAKNPASFNSNLDMLTTDKTNYDQIMIVLNDNIPDGRDVSWIYDVDTLKLKKYFEGKNIIFAGKRAYDMAVRFEYAGIPVTKECVFTDLYTALSSEFNKSKSILILPNYSAMLEVRKILIGKNIL